MSFRLTSVARLRSWIASGALSTLYRTGNFRGKVRLARALGALLDGTVIRTASGPKIGARFVDFTGSINACEVNERFFDFIATIGPDDLFIDVGANIGLMSLIASRRAKAVISIEPSPVEIASIYKHIQINKCTNVFPIQMAASSEYQGLTLARREDSGLSSISTMSGSRPEGLYPIVGLPIDALIRSIGVTRLYREIYVKIDVEGFELGVLQGMKEALQSRKVRDIFVELGKERTMGDIDESDGHDAVYSLMASYGYHPVYPKESSRVYDQHFSS